METSRSLTQEQQHTLESVYTFVKGAVIYLAAHGDVCREADEVQVRSLVDLGVLCQARLLEQFPEVRNWVFDRGGAQ